MKTFNACQTAKDIPIDLYVSMYVCMYVCIYLRMYVYTQYIYTHMDTYNTYGYSIV